MNNVNTGIDASDVKEILEIIRKNKKIGEVILFGSRAKGNFAPGSDIDLALKGQEITLNDILDLYADLDTLDLPFRFDLVIYNRIKEKSLLDHIERVGINLFRR